ncbi:MAG: YbjQ family protein [Deltaproteobacteria bacterium]|nr:YbjQ family protein [Deltaproteobacteria bacterium]
MDWSVVLLILVGYLSGKAIEKNHLKKLSLQEQSLRDVPVLSTRTISPEWKITRTHLVSGSTVISIDYFKRFAAAIRNIFGGNVRSFEPVLDRARRDALVKMRSSARSLGASYVINVRMETSRIGVNKRGKGVGCAEVLAYGTAIILEK